MTDTTPRRRAGGREARIAARAHAHVEREPFLTRILKPFEVLDEEGLSLIERNADTILQEVGLEFRGDPEALRLARRHIFSATTRRRSADWDEYDRIAEADKRVAMVVRPEHVYGSALARMREALKK